MPTNLNLHLYDGRIALNFMIFTHTLPPTPFPFSLAFSLKSSQVVEDDIMQNLVIMQLINIPMGGNHPVLYWGSACTFSPQ